MKKVLRGSLTVEASLIVPLILIIYAILLNLLFFYHDKNVLAAVAHETAAFAGGHGGTDREEAEEYFSSRIRGKLLLLTHTETEIRTDADPVTVRCSADRFMISVNVECSVKRTDPENYIRDIRKARQIGDEIKDKTAESG